MADDLTIFPDRVELRGEIAAAETPDRAAVDSVNFPAAADETELDLQMWQALQDAKQREAQLGQQLGGEAREFNGVTYSAEQRVRQSTAEARAKLAIYRDRRRSRGEEPFQYLDKARRREQDAAFRERLPFFGQLFSGPDQFDQAFPEEHRAAVAERFAGAMDPAREKIQTANLLLVSEMTGEPVEKLQKLWPAYRNRYAQERLGAQGPVDDAAFYALAGKKLSGEKADGETAEVIAAKVRAAAISARPLAEALGDAKTMAGERWKDLQPAARAAYAQVLADFDDDELATARELFQRTAKIEGADVEKVAGEGTAFLNYSAMPPEKRERVLGLLALQAQGEGEDVQGYFKRVGAAFGSGMQMLARGSTSAAARGEAEVMRKIIERGTVPESMEGVTGKAMSQWTEQDLRSVWFAGNLKGTTTRPMTAEEKEMLAGFAGIAEGQAAFVQDVASAGIKVSRYLDENKKGFWNSLDDWSLMAVESLPLMATAALPYGAGLPLAIQAYGEKNLAELRKAAPDADQTTLERTAYAAGALEAGIDRLQWFTLGARLPKVQAQLLQWGIPGRMGNFIVKAGVITVTEGPQEIVQDLTMPAVQTLASALSDDIPGPDWVEVLEREREALGDIFGVSMIFGIIGGAGSTVMDVMAAPKLQAALTDRQGLALAGFTPETVEQVAKLAETNPAAAAETLKAAVIETPVEVRQANSQAAKEAMEADPPPSMEEAALPVIEQRPDGSYLVRYPDGTADDARSDTDALEAVRMWEAEEIDRMDQANRALARELEASHSDNPELAANFKFTGKAVTMADWAGQNRDKLEIARQRVRIAMRQEFAAGEAPTDGSAVADADLPLDAYLILGSSQNFGTAVTRISAEINQRGNVATVLEEHAEGVAKWLMESGKYSRADIIRGIRETEAATGKQTLADDLDSLPGDQSTQAIVEAFSRLAVANAFGKIPESGLSAKFKALFRALKEAFTAIIGLAADIRAVQLSGQMDEQFEYWLDVAGGVSTQYQLDNLQTAAESELKAAALDGFPEVTETLRGMLPHPSTPGIMFPGETRAIYDGIANSSASGASKAARTKAANAYFLPVGQKADLDEAREFANEKGFGFDTPADMLEALDLSINYGKPQYGIGANGDQGFEMETFSAVRASSPLLAAIDSLAKSPEATAKVFVSMRAKVGEVRDRMDQTRRTAGFSEDDLDPVRFEKLRDLATLEAIAKALPAPIRGKFIGSFRDLEELKTSKGREKYLVNLLPKVEQALESHLVDQFRAAIRREMVRGAVKVAESKTRGGKIGATAHMIFDEAKAAMTLEPDAAEAAALKIQQQIEGADALTMDQLAELDTRMAAIELFHDYQNATSTRLEQGLELLKSTYREGRAAWLEVLMERRAIRDRRVHFIQRGLGLTYLDGEGIERPVMITDAMRTAAVQADKGNTRKISEGFMAAFLSGSQKLRRLGELTEDAEVRRVVEGMEDAFAGAEALETDLNIADNAALAEAMRRILGTSTEYGLAKKLRELSEAKEAAPVEKIEGRKKELVTVPINLVESLLARETGGFTAENGKRVELDEFDLEALQEQWDRFQELQEEDQGRKRTITFPRLIASGKRQSIGRVSQLEGLQLYLTLRQPDQARKLERMGYDENTMADLGAWLKPEVIQLGAWMVGKLAAEQAAVDALHRSEKGVGLRLVDNYFPVRNDVSRADSGGLALDGGQQQQSGRSVGFIKERVANNAPPAYVNALAVFLAHRAQSNFWKSHVTPLREWGGVLRDERFSTAVKIKMGAGYYQSVTRLLERIESGGALAAQQQMAFERWIRSLMRGFSLGTLGMRVSTLMVNTTAALNAALEIPAKDLIKGMMLAARRPEAFKDAWNSPVIRRRLAEGSSVEAKLAKSSGPSTSPILAQLQAYAEKGVAPINYVDTAANLLGAASVWEYTRTQAVAAGMPDAEARTEADAAVERVFRRAAQPTARLSRSELELRALDNPLSALLSLFISEPRKNLAIAFAAGRELLTGKGTYGKAQAAQQIAVSMVVMVAAEYVVRSLYAALAKAKDDEDDEGIFGRWWNRLTDAKAWGHHLATGHLKSIPLAGEAWNQAMGAAFDQKVFAGGANPLNKAVATSFKIADSFGDDATARDSIEGGIDIVQAFGSAAPGGPLFAQIANVADFGTSVATSNGVDFTDADRRARIKGQWNAFEKELEALHGKTTGPDGKVKKDVQEKKTTARADWLRSRLAPLPEAERGKLLEEIKPAKSVRELLD